MSATASKILTYYFYISYSVELIKKINLLRLRHWCFPGKFIIFSKSATGGVLRKKLLLKISQYLQEKCRAAILLKTGSYSNTQVCSSEYCKIFIIEKKKKKKQGKSTAKQNSSACKKYKYRHLGHWYIKSTLYKRFINWNKIFKKIK